MSETHWNASVVHDSELFQEIVTVINMVLLTTAVAGTFGNIFVVYIIIKTASLRIHINASLVSLCIADLFVCILVLPIRFILYNLYLKEFKHLEVICTLDIFFQTTTDIVELFMILVTGYERYQAIVYPFKKDGRTRRTAWLMILSWFTAILAGIFSSLYLINGATIYPCYIQDQTTRMTGEVIVRFPIGVICLLLVLLFYILIFRSLREHNSQMNKKYGKSNKIVPFNEKEPTKFEVVGEKTQLTISSTDEKDKSSENEKSSKTISGETKYKTETSRVTIFRINNEANIESLSSPGAICGNNSVTLTMAPKEHVPHDKVQTNHTENSLETSDPNLNIEAELYIPQTSTSYVHPSKHQGNTTEEVLIGHTNVENEVVKERTRNKDLLINISFDTSKEVKTITTSMDKSLVNANDFVPSVTNYRSKSLIEVPKIECKPHGSTFQMVDIVEMDGSTYKQKAHKDTVVGAVCVMNFKNKEQGKRTVEFRAAKRIACFVVTFVALWLPTPISLFFCSFTKTYSVTAVELTMILSSLSSLTALLNPLLNCMLNRQIRSVVRDNLSFIREFIIKCVSHT
ncbi:hypothetical protein CHS0354_025996 [Potamilus streckersoni]|uniref:G-protein coupled receptors family 1 profile domain-containing protein n=1 Tax=Potamilus streckersoni TaxID=2493646 RepID=A0AAE0VJW7_9BIVA|nr:hypothetical protein CHS0354_025996 [Potamilus streckersoni]